MKILGFNLTKITAENNGNFKPGFTINNSIEFVNIDKAKLDVIKDSEVLKADFKFAIIYALASQSPEKENFEKSEKAKSDRMAQVLFEGNLLLSTEKEETKEIMKEWKKKNIPASYKVPLFNLILRKCSPKALVLEEETNIPSHINIPQVSPSQNQAQ